MALLSGTTDQTATPATAEDALIMEWRPGSATWIGWLVGGTAMAVVGYLGYLLVAWHGAIPQGSTLNFSALQILLLVGLAAVHEGIHGVFMLACGARPQFGILRVGHTPMGFYATSPGHRFGRARYLSIVLAPLAIISPLGIIVSFAVGADMAFPFAIVFGGCVGDLNIMWHVLRAPRGALYEDMRDGLRVWRSAPHPGR